MSAFSRNCCPDSPECTPKAIKIEYFQATGPSLVHLVARAATDPSNEVEPVVPPSWLSPPAPGPLPQGWTLAAAGLPYVSARQDQASIVFTDASGNGHAYDWTGSGYAPAPGEDGVVSVDAAGRVTLHGGGGQSYVFDPAGRPVVSTVALDDFGWVASTCYGWGGDGRLRVIFDPAGGRFAILTYGGDVAGGTPVKTPCNAADQSLNPCPVAPAGFDAVPTGMLCQVSWWDDTTSRFHYRAGTRPQLLRIQDPGELGADHAEKLPPITDFAYRAPDGRLDKLRSPLANDALRAQVIADDDASRTLIAYTADAVPRVASVSLPMVGADRVVRSYAYGADTKVYSGTAPTWLLRSAAVAWDPTARRLNLTETTPAATNAATAVHDAAFRPLESTDTAGRRSSTSRDGDAERGAYPTGRVTDAYGPGPSSCFASTPPTSACPDLAHVATRYDARPTGAQLADIHGLAAAWWDNATLGADQTTPERLLHAVAFAHSDPPEPPLAAGTLPTAPPAGVASPWSARYTGEIQLDSGGEWAFGMSANGQARLWVDDIVVVDAWGAHTNPVTGAARTFAAGRHRVRVDYVPDASPLLSLSWDPPGAPALPPSPSPASPPATPTRPAPPPTSRRGSWCPTGPPPPPSTTST